MRTIIAGSRGFDSMEVLEDAINKCGREVTTVISGGARGADELGEVWAKAHKIPLERYPADWDKYGKSAGYKRNKLMSEVGEALVALWDGKSRGTQHMIRLAEEKGLDIYIYNYITHESFRRTWQQENYGLF